MRTYDEAMDASEGDFRSQHEQEALEDEERDEEERAVMAAQIESLRARLDVTRSLLLPLLPMLERGHVPPAATIDSRLTSALMQCGCAACGRKFSREDATQIAMVRLYGVHAGHCSSGRS